MGAPYPRPSYPRCSPPMVLLLLPLTPPLCRSHGSPRAPSRAASLLPAPPHRRRVLRNRCQGRIVASNATTTPVRDEGAAAVVWFKHDLRIDDHPGLAAAVAEPRRPVVPLYVFDRRVLAGYSDKMLELLLFALKDLKMALKSQESDLLIGLRNAEDVVLKLVNEVTMQVPCTGGT